MLSKPKSKALQNFYKELSDKEDSVFWQYLSSVLLKHAVRNSDTSTKVKFAHCIESKDYDTLEKLIEDALPSIFEDVKREIFTFQQKIVKGIE